MTFEPGSLIYLNFTAKVKDTGEAVESTVEQDAKKLNIYDPTRKYEPRLVAVGEGWVLAGLDEEIKKMDVGEKKSIELSPKKAWGERDPTLLRMIPLRKFGEKAEDLRVGDVVEVDNRVGIVRFIGSGRTQVDFNHRLAGKTLLYDVEAVRKLETDEEKVKALISRRFPGEGDRIAFELKDSELSVEVPEDLFLVEGLQTIKRGIATDVLRFIPSAKQVVFRERYQTTKPKEEKPKEEKPKEKEAEEKPKEKEAEDKPAETKA